MSKERERLERMEKGTCQEVLTTNQTLRPNFLEVERTVQKKHSSQNEWVEKRGKRKVKKAHFPGKRKQGETSKELLRKQRLVVGGWNFQALFEPNQIMQ